MIRPAFLLGEPWSGGMNTIARLILVAVLAFGSGCAKPDWIQQTLVTVDVTGTRQSTEGGLYQLALEQQGSKVTGSVRILGGFAQFSGRVDGAVGGDVFTFTGEGQTGSTKGEMRLTGDEMTGEVWGAGATPVGRRRAIIFTPRRFLRAPAFAVGMIGWAMALGGPDADDPTSWTLVLPTTVVSIEATR
jgi:hypothetical protein